MPSARELTLFWSCATTSYNGSAVEPAYYDVVSSPERSNGNTLLLESEHLERLKCPSIIHLVRIPTMRPPLSGCSGPPFRLIWATPPIHLGHPTDPSGPLCKGRFGVHHSSVALLTNRSSIAPTNTGYGVSSEVERPWKATWCLLWLL